jgi:glucose/arabinose dehydrogenase
MRRRAAALALAFAGGALTFAVQGPAAPALALPAGFTDTAVAQPAGNPLASPTAIVPLPGRRALILEKGGGVRVLSSDGTIAAEDALRLSVCTGSEMGLLGAAADPGFIENGFVYLYYTAPNGNCGSGTTRGNRVSQFTMTGNTIDPASETILLDHIAATGGNHDGGNLAFGPDGLLYVSVGDAGTNPRGSGTPAAQDLSHLNGKILRIAPDGSSPAGNPFVGQPGAVSCATAGIAEPTSAVCTEIYAYGLRNPYRFAFDPNSGVPRFFVNDVGQNTWEEVDEGVAGANYGWPSREGFCAQGSTTSCNNAPAGFTDPLTAYGRGTGCSFITGGAFVPNGWWPKAYDGAYLFADGGCDKIFLRTAAGTVDYDAPFHTGSGTIVDMAFLPIGNQPSLYYVTNGSGELRRISYAASPSNVADALSLQRQQASRAYDTRDPGTGIMPAGTTRMISLGAPGAHARAALVNLTMVEPRGQGYLTAFEARTALPDTSNVNAGSGQIVANSAVVPIDADGNIVVYTSVTTHVIVDVLGVFRAAAPGDDVPRYASLTPARLIDTRELDVPGSNEFTLVTQGGVGLVTAPVAGRRGVPVDAQAVALIVTGISARAAGAGHVTVYPGGGAFPPTSNLNVNGGGDVRPNLVVVPVGGDGTIALRLSNTSDVVVDVAGYFRTTTSSGGLYHVVTPSRQLDTRTPPPGQPLGIGGARELAVAGIPGDSAAISQNVTVTETFGPGFLTSAPASGPLPLASNVNATGANQDRAALSFTKLGPGRTVQYFSSGGTHLVVDVTGYFE